MFYSGIIHKNPRHISKKYRALKLQILPLSYFNLVLISSLSIGIYNFDEQTRKYIIITFIIRLWFLAMYKEI